MIYGIGTDVLDIARVKKILSQPAGERFVHRVLAKEERKLAKERKGRLHEFVAGRFAAKEAVVKALGCGIGKKVGFHDMVILPDALGRPVCSLTKKALERLGLQDRHISIHLSISHSETAVMAFCVIEDRHS